MLLRTDRLGQSPRAPQQENQAPFRRRRDLPEQRGHHPLGGRADDRDQRRLGRRAPLHKAGAAGAHHRYSQRQAARRGLPTSSNLSEDQPFYTMPRDTTHPQLHGCTPCSSGGDCTAPRTLRSDVVPGSYGRRRRADAGRAANLRRGIAQILLKTAAERCLSMPIQGVRPGRRLHRVRGKFPLYLGRLGC